MTSVKGSSLIPSLRGRCQEDGHCSADRQGYCPRPTTFVGLRRRVSWPTAQLGMWMKVCVRNVFSNCICTYIDMYHIHAFLFQVLHIWFVHLEDGKVLFAPGI